MIVLGLLLLLLPGLALTVHLEDEHHDPVSFAAVLGLSGLAVWIVAFWCLRWVPLGLGGLLLTVDGAALLALALTHRRLRAAIGVLRWSGDHVLPLVAMGAVALFRFVPLASASAAPGADMSMHSYMARLILEANGVPTSYAPLLPITEFGSYAAGLPIASALLARISGASIATGALAAACLTHTLLALVIYALVRRRYRPPLALCSTILVTLATRDPQNHFTWGGNPTVLALALAGAGLLLLQRLVDRRWRMAISLAALCLAAAGLTHSVIPYALLFVLPPVLLYRYRQGDGSTWRTLLLRGLVLVAVAALLMAPYLTQIQLSVSEAERAWIMRWQRLPIHLPPGPVWLLPLSLVPYIAIRLGAVYTVLLGAAILARRWLRCGAITEQLLFAGLTLLLTLNALVWWLPGSYAIYPDRVMLLLTFPFSMIMASTLEGAAQTAWSQRGPAARRMLATVTVLALIPGAYLWYVRGLDEVSVTRDDLQAIAWIARNTSPGDVLENNYGDAGIWIPALAFRPVHTPHINVVYLDEVTSWRQRVQPSWLFLGAKKVYDADSPHSHASVATQSAHYRQVFRQGDAAVYRILQP